MTTGRRLLLVHAHPDDECLQTGGAIARYASEGVSVTLVTCTDGELGEIDPAVDVRPEDLGEHRRGELRDACRILGIGDLRMLGYRDSGMVGTPANDDPASFVNQPLDEPASRVADILLEVRPDVVITYDDTGFYGHPDHIRAHQVAVRGLELASDGLPAPRLYYSVISRGALLAFRDMVRATDPGEEPEYLSDDAILAIGTDDELITAQLDVNPYVDHKVRALQAHASQRGTTRTFLDLPPDMRGLVLGTEYFQLAGAGPVDERSDDLFA